METETSQPGDGKPDRQYKPNETTWIKRSIVEAQFRIAMNKSKSMIELETIWRLAYQVFTTHNLTLERLGVIKDEKKILLKKVEETIGQQTQFIAL